MRITSDTAYNLLKSVLRGLKMTAEDHEIVQQNLDYLHIHSKDGEEKNG